MLWWDWREETKGWVPLYSNHPMSCVSSIDHPRNYDRRLQFLVSTPLLAHPTRAASKSMVVRQLQESQHQRHIIKWDVDRRISCRCTLDSFSFFLPTANPLLGPHCRPLPSISRSKSHHQKARTRATGPLIESLPLSSPPTWSAGMVAYSFNPPSLRQISMYYACWSSYNSVLTVK